MTQATYYHATLVMRAPLLVEKDAKKGGIKIAVMVGDRRLSLIAKKKLMTRLEHDPPEGEQGLIVWPRTDKEGLLGSGTQLAAWKAPGEITREPGLHALGQLVKVDKENALLQIQIHPNEGQGSLKKSFKLPLVATLELLERLPELGSGLEVWGELKPRTGRVIVTRVQAVPLPPMAAPATDAQGAEQAAQ